jgi:hypothetical protein
MTTIAYSAKHKIMAADSRCTDEHDAHCWATKKIYRLANGALYGSAGESDDRDVRDLLGKSTPRRMPSRVTLAALKINCKALIVFPKGQCFSIDIKFDGGDNEPKEWAACVDLVTDPVVAVGSGYQFALGALDSGKSPREAVRVACKRDTKSALPVQWETV